MQRTSAAAVSTYAFVNPLVAVLLGWALVGETIDRRGVIATALIVAAVVSLQGSRWIEVRRRLRPRAPRPSPASPPSPPIAAGPEPAAVCCERTAEGGRYRMSR
jgi:hypothetical protein